MLYHLSSYMQRYFEENSCKTNVEKGTVQSLGQTSYWPISTQQKSKLENYFCIDAYWLSALFYNRNIAQ
jgi:hypothetical protein